MTPLYFFLLLLISLYTIQSSHAAVQLAVTYNAGTSGGGTRYTNQIGNSYALQKQKSATTFIWRLFQQNDEASRKAVPKVTLFIDNSNGVAYAVNNEIHVNANYLGNYTGDVKTEFTGVLYHEMTHIWQWNGNGNAPGGLIEGIADFVRLKANYAPSHWVKPGQGDRWDQGYDVTARFLDYCNGLRSGFVADLNKKMKGGYSDGFFVDLLGKSVGQIWTDYKAQYGN